MPRGTKSAPGPLSQAVGAELRAEMARQNVTVSALSGRVTIMSRTQLGQKLQGVKHFDIEELDLVCQALGLNVIDVMRVAGEATDHRRI